MTAEEIRIEQYENYQKRSYRNRCYLASPSGLQLLSVPLEKGKNNQQVIRDVLISYHQNWPAQHWKTIKSLYGNAPFFEEYAHIVGEILHQKHKFLFDLNQRILQEIIKILRIDKEITFTNAYQQVLAAGQIDCRQLINPVHSIPDPHFNPRPYGQVFMEHTGFLPNLSILDLLFCSGPETKLLLINSCLPY